MSNLLQQLENNEAVLLMYLAGELPDADRAEVDQMLAGDAGMRLALAELSAMQDQMTTLFAQEDASPHLSRREAAVREVSRAINQAKVDALQPPSPVAQPPRTRSRIPFWAYPAAAAALLLVGIMLFSGNHPAKTPPEKSTGSEYAIAPQNGPVEIIPVVSTDDSLSKIQNGLLALQSGNDLDLFSSGATDLNQK